MSNKNKMPVPDFLKLAENIKKRLVTRASREGVKFFKGRFREQAWYDKNKEPWVKRMNSADPGRAILIGRGFLRDSIRVVYANEKEVKFGTDVKYAKIHNEGGTIRVRVTPRSRKFFWFMYYKTNNPKWKGMALTTKQHFDLKIPKRQFIGHSEKLIGELDSWVLKEIENGFKKAINNA